MGIIYYKLSSGEVNCWFYGCIFSLTKVSNSETVKKCIKMGIIYSKLSFGEVNCWFYGCMFRFTVTQ